MALYRSKWLDFTPDIRFFNKLSKKKDIQLYVYSRKTVRKMGGKTIGKAMGRADLDAEDVLSVDDWAAYEVAPDKGKYCPLQVYIGEFEFIGLGLRFLLSVLF